MLKVVLAGLWVCAVSLGAVFLSVHLATAPVEDPEIARKAGLELVKGESITIPLIADGKVSGYFLGRVSFMMNKEKMAGATLPMTELMTDEMFTLLVGNKMVDLDNMSAFDVGKFRELVKTDLNTRLGDGFIDEVLVEQLDFLSKDSLRANGEAQGKPPNKPVAIVEGQALPTTATAGH